MLTCAFASRRDVVLVSLPGAAFTMSRSLAPQPPAPTIGTALNQPACQRSGRMSSGSSGVLSASRYHQPAGMLRQIDLTCDKIVGLEGGRAADLRGLTVL